MGEAAMAAEGSTAGSKATEMLGEVLKVVL